jgi:FtsH-binding integral membrane protein
MALNPNQFATRAGTVDQAEIDAGLRSYMLRVYNYMALGVAFTGAIVLFMAMNPNLMVTLAVGPMKWVLFAAVIGMGFFSPKIISMKSTGAAHAFYWVYCALWGVMISPMVAFFLQSTGGTMDVARAFFITAGMFAGSSLFGYVTKRDLSGMGRFLMMATIGLLIAMLVNLFFVESTGFSLMLSIGVVLVFAAITAYDTQNIKNMYMENMGDEAVTRFALFGALQLYGTFVVMFIHILNILAILRGE